MSCSLRSLAPAHRAPLEALVAGTAMFRPSEVAVATQLLDAHLAGDEDYRFIGAFNAEVDGELVGYACWGPTPGTEGTNDLYWIVVERTQQGSGVGSQLLDHVERTIRAEGGRLIVVETSSRADYTGTRAFYERRGYTRAANLPGYYAPGDDLVIYLKDLTDG